MKDGFNSGLLREGGNMAIFWAQGRFAKIKIKYEFVLNSYEVQLRSINDVHSMLQLGIVSYLTIMYGQ